VPKPAKEDALVAKMFDASSKEAELAEAIKQLSPEQAQFFLTKLEAAYRKRKIQLTGYLVSIGMFLGGFVTALIYQAKASGFTAWIWLLPFGLVGLTLFAFGRWSEQAGKLAAAAAEPVTKKPAASE
jgi:hypothetical protein